VPRIRVVDSSAQRSQPKSKAYEGFTLTCRGETWQGRWTSGQTHLVLIQKPNRQRTMTINMVDSSYQWAVAGGRTTTGAPFSAEVLRAWMADAGVDVAAPGVSRELDDIVAQVDDMATGGMSFSGAFDGGGSSSSAGTRDADWVSFVRTMAGVVWISGIVILRRARRVKA
jgi:hypothetical protein